MPDTLLRKIPREDMSEELGYAYDRSLARHDDATLVAVFANHPELYSWYRGELGGDIFTGGLLDRRIKELARLRMAINHGFGPDAPGTRRGAMAAGLTGRDLAAVAAYESSDLPEAEKVVLRLADLLGSTDEALSPALYRELRQHFDDAQILELGLVLAILSGTARFLSAFDLVEKTPPVPGDGRSDDD